MAGGKLPDIQDNIFQALGTGHGTGAGFQVIEPGSPAADPLIAGLGIRVDIGHQRIGPGFSVKAMLSTGGFLIDRQPEIPRKALAALAKQLFRHLLEHIGPRRWVGNPKLLYGAEHAVAVVLRKPLPHIAGAHIFHQKERHRILVVSPVPGEHPQAGHGAGLIIVAHQRGRKAGIRPKLRRAGHSLVHQALHVDDIAHFFGMDHCPGLVDDMLEFMEHGADPTLDRSFFRIVVRREAGGLHVDAVHAKVISRAGEGILKGMAHI